jgi:hypothetical protein
MIDSVNHPKHYERAKFECIEIMDEIFGEEAVKHFCLLNAFKYLFRCMNKHEDPREDIEKARWYLDRYLKEGEK